MFGSLHPPYNAGFLRTSKPEKLQPLPPDEDKVDPPPQERKEDPSAIGLAATTDDDNRTPSPTKEVTFAASSDKSETIGETAGETPPSPSNSMKEASPETSASQDSSGAKIPPPPGLPEGKPHVQIATESQGLHQDEKKGEPPLAGHGRKVLRERQLEGLPADLRVELLTGYLYEDFVQFKEVNAQYNPKKAWYWFKDITRRYGQEIEDSDWKWDPEEIGQRGSQPEQEPYGDSRAWDPKKRWQGR